MFILSDYEIVCVLCSASAVVGSVKGIILFYSGLSAGEVNLQIKLIMFPGQNKFVKSHKPK